MASINKVILIGRLGQDPETRFMTNKDAITTISMATDETWKDKNGEKQHKTEWHRVVFYKKLAEIAGEYLKKGSQVYIEGKLETKKWNDKNGVEKQTTQIIADTMKMLGDNPNKGSNGAKSSGKNYQPKGSGFDDMDDDMPF